MIEIHFGDNLEVLRGLPDCSARLIYIDPPFNTGKVQTRTRTRKTRDDAGSHVGFGGKRYVTENLSTMSFRDSFDEFCEFLEPRLHEAKRMLTADGSLFLHLDYRECHYAKVLCDSVFGRESFKNEIVWAYDYGGRPKNRWPAKHDNILWYAADPDSYVFRYDDIDRIPYMAPGLVTSEKAARGKIPTDVWWHTIVPTNSRERTGYPTQKPLGIVRRIVTVHSDPGDLVVDFFAGSGTTGEAAAMLGRRALLVDNNPEALTVMEKRFATIETTFLNWTPSLSSSGQLRLT
ncbi:MAG: site-specific DNA-methyltransferase [Actinomycetota bacterium]|nr:site-specific DNA-methyltransferase [Actinomycetota bacterium]